jgi:hypothetical protein
MFLLLYFGGYSQLSRKPLRFNLIVATRVAFWWGEIQTLRLILQTNS